ncbi:MAG: hydrogenase maturation protease [Desulfobacterales bacterium]|nr:hydrogenase maturation protease [Desulfobacterales bacterium]
MFRTQIKNQEIWIIGYGNPRRGDDGIGPHIVKILKKMILSTERIYFRAIPQLTPDLIEDLQNANFILFIDATVKKLKKGWQLLKIQPDFSSVPFLTHHVTPAFLLGLFQSVHMRCPSAWLVSVQGYDFGMEDEFYPETQRNIENAVSFIYRFVNKMTSKKKAEGIKKNRRMQWEMERTY